MKFTINSALKYIKMLEEEKRKILSEESKSMTFSYLANETPYVPSYNFQEISLQLSKIDQKIVAIRHKISEVGITTIVDTDQGLTADNLLVMLPLLSDRKRTLERMRKIPEKERRQKLGGSEVSEYIERNFDITEVDEEYFKISALLVNYQELLNKYNTLTEFDIDIED